MALLISKLIMKLAMHFLVEGTSFWGVLHKRTSSGGAWVLCGLFCVTLAPFPVQAARSKQGGTACAELSYRDAGPHPKTEDLIPVIMQPHLFAFLFLPWQAEKAQESVCRDAEGVSHAEPGGDIRDPCVGLREVGRCLAGHRTEVGRCQWAKWRLLQNKISEDEISEVAGNTTEFYGSAWSFNFLSISSHSLTAILLLLFTFSLHSLLLAKLTNFSPFVYLY